VVLAFHAFLEAHDSEVLALDWAHGPQPDTAPGAAGGESRRPGLMLASAGRDGFVHVFRSGAGGGAAGGDGLLTPLDTLDDHGGAAVAAARFGGGGSRRVTFGGDRSVAVRALSVQPGGKPGCRRVRPSGGRS
jgi:hypothetical protein